MRILIKIFRHTHYRLSNFFAPIYLRIKGVKLGEEASFGGIPIVHGEGRIYIARGCDFRSHSAFATMGVEHPCLFNCLGPEATIEIGSNCGLTGVTICAKQRVELGSRVMVGSGAVIVDTDFHPIHHAERGMGSDIELALSKPVVIGDDCFIGARSIVLKGVSLGARTVVGAGAVVTKSFPADVVIGGNPARVIRDGDRAK